MAWTCLCCLYKSATLLDGDSLRGQWRTIQRPPKGLLQIPGVRAHAQACQVLCLSM